MEVLDQALGVLDAYRPKARRAGLGRWYGTGGCAGGESRQCSGRRLRTLG
jgi:hypothetical protein